MASTNENNACIQCGILRDKIEKFQCHNHTFTCEKKKKSMTIKSNEGHGRLDNMINGPDLINIPVCRFRFPKFPLDETKLVFGIPKDTDKDKIKRQKDDLSKVMKYLIRQTYTERKIQDSVKKAKFLGILI